MSIPLKPFIRDRASLIIIKEAPPYLAQDAGLFIVKQEHPLLSDEKAVIVMPFKRSPNFPAVLNRQIATSQPVRNREIFYCYELSPDIPFALLFDGNMKVSPLYINPDHEYANRRTNTSEDIAATFAAQMVETAKAKFVMHLLDSGYRDYNRIALSATIFALKTALLCKEISDVNIFEYYLKNLIAANNPQLTQVAEIALGMMIQEYVFKRKPNELRYERFTADKWHLISTDRWQHEQLSREKEVKFYNDLIKLLPEQMQSAFIPSYYSYFKIKS